jgi:hypothetical protein
MGLSEFFGSVANVYNKVKAGVSEVYNFGKSVVHKARGGFDWVDEQLDKASSIPFIGELLQEGIDELRDTQIFGVSWDRLKKHVDKLDNWIQGGEIEALGQNLDNAITGVLQAGEKYGGIADQAFSGGQQTMGGLMT